MIGLFKFILSLLVIASHTGLYFKIPEFNWFNQGIFAVIPFFIFSGYFTSLVLDKEYKHKKSPLDKSRRQRRAGVYHQFIFDKFKKISPQYYFYAIFAFIFILLTQPQNITISLLAIITNLTIIPLNFHHYFKISLFSNSYYDGILPPAWYLAALFQYYLLAPIIHKSKYFKNFLWLVSGSVFILALFNFIPNNFYSYRFIGNFLFFLIGDLFYQIINKSRHSERSEESRSYSKISTFYFLLSTFSILTIIQFANKQIFELDTNAPILFGFLFFAPITFFLLKKSSKIRPTKLDRYLSSISFSIFLNHYVFVYIFNYLKMVNLLSFKEGFAKFALVTFTSVIFAIFAHFLSKINQNKQ